MIEVTLERPWLIADLGRPRRVLSWAINRPGFVTADRVVWREVKNADLPIGFDAGNWFQGELLDAGQDEAVAMMTSRDIGTYRTARAEVEGVVVDCVATVGLSNAESVGHRRPVKATDWGTINVALAVSAGMSEPAQLEALSIAIQARTAAVIGAGLEIETGRATGTGTDCLALAADPGEERYAGLHTAIGEAVGKAVFSAVSDGAADWMEWLYSERLRLAH